MKMRMLAFGVLSAGLLTGFLTELPAYDGKDEGPSGKKMQGDDERAKRKEAVDAYLSKLQKDNPTEYKRLTELRKNDQEAFRAEIRKCLKPGGAPSFEGKDSAGPSKQDGPKRDQSFDDEKAKRKEAVDACLNKLQKDNPAEYKRLMELRKNDQEAFRAEMRKFLKPGGKDSAVPFKQDSLKLDQLSDEDKVKCKEIAKAFVDKLQKDNPAAFKRLEELRKNDPEAFRAEVEKLMKAGQGAAKSGSPSLQDFLNKGK